MGVARGLRDSLQLFRSVGRNANLRRLELAWTCSNLASRASALAVAVYAYETGGTRAVGIVLFVRLAVAAGASPWLAVLADRRPRRSVMVGSEVVRALMLGTMAPLALLGTGRPVVYALAVLVATADPLFRSAQAALTPSLVERPEELTAANVVASAVESVGLFAGPALGGVLLVVSSSGTLFAVSGGVLLLSIGLVARIDVAGRPSPRERESRLHGWLAGWGTIVAEPSVRVVVGLYSLQTLVAGMLNVLVVVAAIRLLGLGTAGVGWLAGMVGIGAFLGIAVVAGAAGREQLSRHFAAGLLLWGFPFLVIAAWPSPASAFGMLALVGIGNTLVDVTGVTLMQRGAPDAVLARVFGAFEALVASSMGIGSLLVPVLVAALSVRATVLAAGLVMPVALAFSWRPLAAVDRVWRAPRDRIELLRRVAIFAPLPAPELERLASALEAVRVDRGSVVFAEGARGDRFYVIAEGEVAVEHGGRRIQQLGPGDFFGEIALLRDVPRTATVQALTPLRLFALERDVFVATVTGHAVSAGAAGSIVAARIAGPVVSQFPL